MFVRHYGPALAVAGGAKGPGLAAACVAVQLVDFAWAGFILGGVEYATIVPGHMAMSHLDFHHMPYTHSLPTAVAWSLGAMLGYRALFRAGGWIGAGLIGLAVFSHWLMDFLVHAPDLGLWFDQYKVGLGWWRSPMLTIGAEFGGLAIGLALYLRRTRANGRSGAVAPLGFVAILAALAAYNWLNAPPPAIAPVAISALLVFSVIALLAL
jgi:hypothetical protein